MSVGSSSVELNHRGVRGKSRELRVKSEDAPPHLDPSDARHRKRYKPSPALTQTPNRRHQAFYTFLPTAVSTRSAVDNHAVGHQPPPSCRRNRNGRKKRTRTRTSPRCTSSRSRAAPDWWPSLYVARLPPPPPSISYVAWPGADFSLVRCSFNIPYIRFCT